MSFRQFDASYDSSDLDAFDGTTRLFPLPNVVLFPGVLLPLHIFEPRYRQMVGDAMQGDRLITMVLLKPGHADEYDSSPPIFDVGCIGRIMYFESLPDGRSNLVLKGLRRVQIQSELASNRMYRKATAMILHDCCADELGEPVASAVRKVLDTMTEILRFVGRDGDADKLSVAGELSAGNLTDLACHCLGLDIQAKQSLLAELSVARRVEALLAWMDALLQSLRRRREPSDRTPPFSLN